MDAATSVALFDHFAEAHSAVDDLIRSGIANDKIALLSNNAAGDHPQALSNPAFGRPDDEEPEAPKSIGAGAGIGAGMGGVMGFLVGALTLAIPGIGPVVAAGIWTTTAAGAGLGAIAGGILSALNERGISEEDAKLYCEGLRRGGTLVTVHADKDQIESIAKTFKEHGAVDIERRSASWQADGWVGFEPDAHPLTAAEVEAMRQLHRDSGHQVDHHHAIRHYFIRSEPAHLAGISSGGPG